MCCLLTDGQWDHPDAVRGIARLKRDGLVDTIPALSTAAIAALAPVSTTALVDRLTLLGLSMPGGKDGPQMSAWLHETGRLLHDLPEDILFNAIDECVKEPGRIFVPTVGEIREKAAGPLRQRERTAARLRKMAILIEDGEDIPPAEPEMKWSWPVKEEVFDESTRCTPEEAAAICAEFGLSSTATAMATRHLGPAKAPTRADYIALGVDPSILDRNREPSGEMPC